MIAGVTYWRSCFRLFSDRTQQAIEFLKVLHGTIREKKLLIIWDRLQAHRSKLVHRYVEDRGGAIALEFLPAYAPEINSKTRLARLRGSGL